MNRSSIGRQNYEAGARFEERVAELYRLLHYQVEEGRIFDGRQVDLFIRSNYGDLDIQRAIECKAGPVKADELDAFLAKLTLVRRQYPAASGTIVSGVTFTDGVTAHAAAAGIQLVLYRDLAARLFDPHGYARAVIRESEQNDRYRVPLYIEPHISYTPEPATTAAFSVVSDWLEDPDWRQFTLLGDVGTGKSFFSRMVAYRLAQDYLQNPITAPFPVRIDLRNTDRELSLEGLILTHLSQNGLSNVTFEMFQYALGQGQVVLILDGFDEMAARVTRQVTIRNFLELARAVQGRAKVLLTCRTHYFKSRSEEEEIVLGDAGSFGSETARELYWELIARKGFKIGYLQPFSLSQVEQYVARAKPDGAKEAIAKIRSTYNLGELSQRPMLLEMIVLSIDKLTAKEVNAATLYQVFTDAWIHRDKWRNALSPEAKAAFLTSLALRLWEDETSSMHYSRLTEHVHRELAAGIPDAQQLAEVDSEIRTASFLTRDEHGNYGFAHKSYAEFFVAAHVARELAKGNIEAMDIRRFSPEVIHFIQDMSGGHDIEDMLARVLVSPYRPRVSENALLCLYRFRRHSAEAETVPVDLPVFSQLPGAQLDQVDLSGARLHVANLADASLAESVLTNADLSEASLDRCRIDRAILDSARLTKASLKLASCVGVSFEGADLIEADLIGADFSDAYLAGARLDETKPDGIILAGATLPSGVWREARQDPAFNAAVAEDSAVARYWLIVADIHRELINIAGFFLLASAARGVEAEDVVSDVLIEMSQPRAARKFVELENSGQIALLTSAIQRKLKLRHFLATQALADYANNTGQSADESFLEMFLDESLAEEEPSWGTEEDETLGAISTEREFSDEDEDDEEVSLDEMEELAVEDAGLQESLLAVEMKEILSDRVWHVVESRYFGGDSADVIATRLAVSPREVLRMLQGARSVLREHFRLRAEPEVRRSATAVPSPRIDLV